MGDKFSPAYVGRAVRALTSKARTARHTADVLIPESPILAVAQVDLFQTT